MTFLPTPPHIVIPVPNGFDAIVSADRYAERDRNIDPNAVTIAELADYVRANQRPINLTRKAVHLAWQRPLTIEHERLPVAKIEELNRTFCLHSDYQYAFLDAIGKNNHRQTGWLRESAKDTQRSLMMLELAIQAFRWEQRRLPQTLAELVPDLFAELPRDPYTNQPFIYRRHSNMKFLLYSVGSDCDDDCGMAVSWHAFVGQPDNGDFFLDRCDDAEGWELLRRGDSDD